MEKVKLSFAVNNAMGGAPFGALIYTKDGTFTNSKLPTSSIEITGEMRFGEVIVVYDTLKRQIVELHQQHHYKDPDTYKNYVTGWSPDSRFWHFRTHIFDLS